MCFRLKSAALAEALCIAFDMSRYERCLGNFVYGIYISSFWVR